jgi:hypothetical protein
MHVTHIGGRAREGYAERSVGMMVPNPQTVLKTADLGSATVSQRPLEFDLWLANSMIDRTRPRLSIMLAVILTVSVAVNRSLRPVQKWRSEFAERR